MAAKSTQHYRFCKASSILGTLPDEYSLTMNEYHSIYSFYVTYSMCKTLSAKKRDFRDYGWATNSTTDQVISAVLKGVLKLQKNPEFVFTEKDDLAEQFKDRALTDGPVADLAKERAVIGITPEDNNYYKLFHRIRNGLAHGKFRLCYSPTNEKMIIIQDNDHYNVTARIVLRLSTVIGFIAVLQYENISDTKQDQTNLSNIF